MNDDREKISYIPYHYSRNKAGEWLVYYFIPSTGLHLGIGKYHNEKEAIKSAYYYLQCHIGECCNRHDGDFCRLTPIYYLEGGENMGIDVVYHSNDDEHPEIEIEATAHIIKILEND